MDRTGMIWTIYYNFLGYIFFLKAQTNFAASQFDPLLERHNLQGGGLHGFLKEHHFPINNTTKTMGNLSLLTLSFHIRRETFENYQTSDLVKLIDTHHPSIFALQATSEKIVEFLKTELGKHYDVAAADAIFIDARSAKKERKPILFDHAMFEKIDEKSFHSKDENSSYATFVALKDKDRKQVFSVINFDLFSADPDITDVQFYQLITYLIESGYSDLPAIFMGTINVVSKDLENLINYEFANLTMKDHNNKNLPKNTFHNHGKFNDNLQRDFILLWHHGNLFYSNYARILSLFPVNDFEHFPVYSILSYNYNNMKK